jgi:exonuclease I
MNELLLRYKGRNFPNSLDENEQKLYEKYRINRLKSQEKAFISELERLKDEMDPGLVEDLLLWYQSLAASDYD